jgi:hypothetical protein
MEAPLDVRLLTSAATFLRSGIASANFPRSMKNLCFICCGLVLLFSACERHPASDLQKIEADHQEHPQQQPGQGGEHEKEAKK